jgi:hypothetical protein
MHFVSLALGLITGVAGIVLIGLNLPIDPVYLGNTLLIIGTFATMGGLVLIGLASAIRQLRRIAQALEARPLPRSLTAEPIEDLGPRVASPLRTPAVVPEPRLEPADEPPVAPPVVAPSPEAPVPMVAAPTAPVEPSAPIEPAIEPAPEPSAEPPPIPAAIPEAPAPSVVALAPEEPEPVPEPEPLPPQDLGPPPPPPPEKIFEAIWAGEPVPVARREVVVASSSATHVDVIEPAPPAPEPTHPDIFKSGVIDGMAYTLYTDGSIEAELAHGTVKFASIDELRAYLAAREI